MFRRYLMITSLLFSMALFASIKIPQIVAQTSGSPWYQPDLWTC